MNKGMDKPFTVDELTKQILDVLKKDEMTIQATLPDMIGFENFDLVMQILEKREGINSEWGEILTNMNTRKKLSLSNTRNTS